MGLSKLSVSRCCCADGDICTTPVYNDVFLTWPSTGLIPTPTGPAPIDDFPRFYFNSIFAHAGYDWQIDPLAIQSANLIGNRHYTNALNGRHGCIVTRQGIRRARSYKIHQVQFLHTFYWPWIVNFLNPFQSGLTKDVWLQGNTLSPPADTTLWREDALLGSPLLLATYPSLEGFVGSNAGFGIEWNYVGVSPTGGYGLYDEISVFNHPNGNEYRFTIGQHDMATDPFYCLLEIHYNVMRFTAATSDVSLISHEFSTSV